MAYSASKFALCGAIQGLREALKNEGIGFTVINPGNVATEEVLSDRKNGFFEDQQPIPISDISSTVEWLMSLSGNVEIGDVNLSQKLASKSIQATATASVVLCFICTIVALYYLYFVIDPNKKLSFILTIVSWVIL